MFAKSKAGVTTPSVITLTAVKQNTSATANWSTSPSLNLYTAASGGSVATTGDTVYLRATELGSNTSVTVTLTCDSIVDTQTFALLNEGADGAAGLSALTPILSNSAHTVPADNAGAVLSGGYAGSGTNIRVFEGVGDLLYTSSVTPSAGEFRIADPVVSPSGAITPGSFSVSVSDPLQNCANGLVGKFFNGGGRTVPAFSESLSDSYWRDAAITGAYSTDNIGNIGTLPLNNSTTITGSRPTGLLSLSSIDYSSVGTNAGNYGFIAIGYFKPPISGTNNYYFELASDDYSAVWVGDYAVGVNNRTLTNATTVANVGTNNVRNVAVSLNSNNYYAIRIVMEEGYGADNLRFRWSSDNQATWNTDLTQNFKAPPAVNGTYNYIKLSGTDDYYNSVSSLVHFETYGAWGSESSSFTNRTFNRGGGAYAAGVPATSPIGSLYALLLNGSNDYVSFNGPDPLYSGGSTTPWTVECWVYTSTGGPIFTREYGSGDPEDPSGYDCPIWIGLTNGYDPYTSGLYPAIAWLKSGVWYYGSISETAVTANTWTHLAFVFTGSSFKIFKDGTDVSANGFSNVTIATTSYDLVSRLPRSWYIGAATVAASRFNGYIDEFRITKGVARYTDAFTRPSAPFPSDTTYKPTVALGQGAGGVDVSNHSAMSNSVDVATITYPITAKRANGTSTALSLVQTITKSKAGATGASARSVDVTASSYVVNYNADNSTPAPSSITLTATPRNVTGTATYSFNGNTAASATTFGYNPATTYNAAPVTIPVILYENGTQVATDSITISSVKPGTNGSAGAAAITVVMPNDSHVLPTTTAGTVTYTGSGTTIQVYEGNTLLNFVSTLTHTSTTGSFTVTASVGSGTLSTPGTITGQGLGTTATVGNHDGLSTDSATVNYTINIRRINNAGDVTVIRTQSLGKSNQGAKGDTGTSALSGYLTNESHTIPAASDGTVNSSDYTAAGGSFKVFFGTNDVTSNCTFGAPSGSTGTVTISTPDSTTGAYTVSGLTTDSASRTLTATYNSATISKVYSISKSKSGGAGAPAKTVTLTASGQTFKYNAAGTATPSTQTLTFTVNLQNVTGTASYSIVGYNSSGTSTGSIKSSTGNTFTLTNSEFLTNANTVNAVVTVTLDSITDTVSVVKVSDGAKGDAGLAGITTVVSNPSVVLAAASNGTVVSGGYANSGTNIRVLEGTTDLVYTGGTLGNGQFTVASPPTISPSNGINPGSYSAATGGGDSSYNNVTLALHMNSLPIVDTSPLARTITNNNVTVSSSINKFGGGSGLFDGSTGRLQFTSTSDPIITNSTTAFTVEYWAYVTVDKTQNYVLTKDYPGAAGAANNKVNFACGFGNGSTSPGSGMESGGLYPMFGYWNGSAWYYGAVANQAVSLNTWAHIACVFTGSTSKIYIDGVDRTNTNAPIATSWDANAADYSETWYVGRRWDYSATFFQGYIDDLRITKGVARYTGSTFVLPTAQFPDTVSGSGTGGVNVAQHVNMTVDAATITYPITLKRADGTPGSLTLSQSIAKSKQGQDGNPGGGSTGPRTASGYVYYTVSTSSAPGTPTASANGFDFTTGAFTGLTTNWQSTFSVPDLSGNTSGVKYWASRYTVSEATFGGTQTISFSTAFVWTNFDGLVTFTNLAAGKNAAGTVSKTLIDGASITSGSITTNSLTVTGFSDSAILNAGFEEQDALDSTLPAKWKRYGVWGGTTATAYRDTSQSRSGTASVTLNPGAGNSADIYADAIPVNQGDVWYVSCRAKSSGTNAGTSPGFYLRVRGGTGPTDLGTELQLAVEDVAVPSSSTWTQYSGQVTIPEGMKWARPILLNYSSNTGAAVTIDEVEFKKATGNAQIAGTLTANRIDTTGLTVKNNAGEIILSTDIGLSSRNMAYNPSFWNPASGGSVTGWIKSSTNIPSYGTGNYELATNTNNDYTLSSISEGLAAVWVPGGIPAGSYYFDAQQDDNGLLAVTPGQRLELQALLNCHRCTGYVKIWYYDAVGNYVTEANGNGVTYSSGVTSLSAMRRSAAFVTVPNGAVTARIGVRGDTNGQNDPYVFFARIFVAPAAKNQVAFGPWDIGGNYGRMITSAAVGNAISSFSIAKVASNNTTGSSVSVTFSVPAGSSGILVDESLGPAYQAYSAGCFPSGTLISTPAGKVPIETVKVGDQVFAFNHNTEKTSVCTVTELFEHLWQDVGVRSPLIKVFHETGTISLTKNHLVYNEEKGYLAENSKYVPAEDLIVGDYLTLENGTKSQILRIEGLPPYEKVYNFEVSDYHTYIADNIRVHNGGGGGDIGGGGKFGGTTIYGPILSSRTLDGNVIGSVKLAVSAGSHTVTVTRSTYSPGSTMYLRVLIFQR